MVTGSSVATSANAIPYGTHRTHPDAARPNSASPPPTGGPKPRTNSDMGGRRRDASFMTPPA
ncbi:hypothetical protein GCM10017752_48220 [Streptomyces roseoviridis]